MRDEEIRQAAEELGLKIGPITATTRPTYIKKIEEARASLARTARSPAAIAAVRSTAAAAAGRPTAAAAASAPRGPQRPEYGQSRVSAMDDDEDRDLQRKLPSASRPTPSLSFETVARLPSAPVMSQPVPLQSPVPSKRVATATQVQATVELNSIDRALLKSKEEAEVAVQGIQIPDELKLATPSTRELYGGFPVASPAQSAIAAVARPAQTIVQLCALFSTNGIPHEEFIRLVSDLAAYSVREARRALNQ